MRCFLVMMDETRRVILDSGGERRTNALEKNAEGAETFLVESTGGSAVVWRSHVLGACWTTVRGPVLCVSFVHIMTRCVCCAVMIF